VEQGRGTGARLGWAAGVTLAIVAWGYLVWLAIDFGRTARNGDSEAWWMLGLAALGAVACLFVALLMVARLMDGRTAQPGQPEEGAPLEAPYSAPAATEPEPTLPIATPVAAVEPTPDAIPEPTPDAIPEPAPVATPLPATPIPVRPAPEEPVAVPSASVGPVVSTQIAEPVPYVPRRAAAAPATPATPAAPAAQHEPPRINPSYPGAGKRSAGRHAGPAQERPATAVPPGVAGKRRAKI